MVACPNYNSNVSVFEELGLRLKNLLFLQKEPLRAHKVSLAKCICVCQSHVKGKIAYNAENDPCGCHDTEA